SFIQYAQLLIQKSSYELRTLILLGYNYLKLCRMYILIYAGLLTAIFILVAVASYFFQGFTYHQLLDRGFEISRGLHERVIIFGIVIIALLIAIQSFSIYRSLKKMAE